MKMPRSFYFALITLLGSALRLDIAVHLWHPPAGFAGSDYIDPGHIDAGFIAFFFVAIWFTYRRHLRTLDHLSGQVEESILLRLSQNAFLMALFGYLMLPLPVVLMAHRH